MLILSKGKPFSGAQGQNWNQWVNRFEAQTASFSDADRIQCLVALLEEKALDSYASFPDKVKTSYSGTRAALAARYGSDIGILQAQAELAGIMQGPGESVVDFADRIRLLGRAAYPHADENDVSVQMNLASRFLCGLRDEQLQARLCGEDLHTLQAVADKACALHKRQATVSAMRQATAGVRSVAAAAQLADGHAAVGQSPGGWDVPAAGKSGVCPPYHSPGTVPSGAVTRPCAGADGLDRDPPHLWNANAQMTFDALPVTRPPSGGEGSAPLHALERRLDAVQQALRELQTADRRRDNVAMGGPANSEHSRSAQRMTGTRRGTGGRSEGRRGRCWTCGEQGTHYARECPHSGERPNPRGERPFCLGCGRSGHWLVDCRLLSGAPVHQHTYPAAPRDTSSVPPSGMQGN